MHYNNWSMKMWRSKDKSRAWWFQNLPHGLQNRHRSCCRSRHRSRWGLPAPLFCLGHRWSSPRSPTASSFALREKPASPWRVSLESANLALAHVYSFLPRADEEPASSMERSRKTHGDGTLRRLLFVTAEPHSLGGGGGQHRGRRTGTWPRGRLLAEPPLRVAGHTCDGDEAATETRKAEAGEGDIRRKVGRSVYYKGSDAQMIWWLTNTRRQWRGGARSVRMKNNFLFPF
jgi:hypothetical protein